MSSTETSSDWCDPTTEATSSSAWVQTDTDLASAVCELGWRPIFITGLIRDLLIRHFADPTNIEEKDLRHLVWKADERTGILVESVHRWRGELTEKRPAVVIKRNAYKSMRVALNDMTGKTEKGFEQFTQLWIGSHTLFCIHGTGASTELLATEVQRELTEFSPIIRQYLGLHKFVVTEVGAISEVEEATENFVVPINLGWTYDESWTLEPESLPLRRVPLDQLCGLDC